MKKHKKLIIIIGVIILIALISTIIIKILDYSLNFNESESQQQQAQIGAEIETVTARKHVDVPDQFKNYTWTEIQGNNAITGNISSPVSGSQTLLAGQTYYIEIAGGRGGSDTYGGGAGGVQAITIQVGSSDVNLLYEIGGGYDSRGDYSEIDQSPGGWPDGQKGLGSGGGGGSTALYLNSEDNLIAAAGGGGGGGKFTAGTGGTGTGGTGTGQAAYNGTNGKLWDGDTVGADVHVACGPDRRRSEAGGFETGKNSYYHESGYAYTQDAYKANYDKYNIGQYGQEFFFILDSEKGNGWGETGDYGGTGGQGYTRTGIVEGCTITLVGAITGSTGWTPGQSWTDNADGNTASGYMKLYSPQYFPYTIEYYYDGVRDDSKTETGPSQKVDTVINSYPDKNIDPEHYSLEKVENFPLTITSNTASNVIRVYYSRSGELIIEKQDAEDNSIKLEGVKFTIRATSGVKNGQYVNMDSNGNAVYQTERCELTTGSDGQIKLKGVFVGTYEVIETYTPHYGYVPEYKGTAVVE